jgi:hypothetical protein
MSLTPTQLANCRRWRAAHPELARERVRKATYKKLGVSDPTRPRPTLCECCGQPSKRRLHLDHDHGTGCFRGWLCIGCNVLLGRMGDSPLGVKATAERFTAYLERV